MELYRIEVNSAKLASADEADMRRRRRAVGEGGIFNFLVNSLDAREDGYFIIKFSIAIIMFAIGYGLMVNSIRFMEDYVRGNQ